MAKQLTFTYDDKDYTLEFTSNSVKHMERAGFVADDLGTKPVSVLPALFAGAFLAHHPTVKSEKIEQIYRRMPNKLKLVDALKEMYNDVIESLLDEPEDDEGNVQWAQNWETKTN